MDELKSMALSGYRKKLWPGTVNDLQGFTKQQAKIRHSFILACKVPGERFPDLEEADIEKVLGTHAAEIIEEELDKSWQNSVNQFRTIWESLVLSKPRLLPLLWQKLSPRQCLSSAGEGKNYYCCILALLRVASAGVAKSVVLTTVSTFVYSNNCCFLLLM
jgi:hypothetical protein